MSEYGSDLIVLSDEDGNEYEFEVLKELETSKGRYAALLPCAQEDEESEDEDIYIVKVVTEGDEDFYEVIEDDAEYEEIAKLFEEAFEADIEEDESKN